MKHLHKYFISAPLFTTLLVWTSLTCFGEPLLKEHAKENSKNFGASLPEGETPKNGSDLDAAEKTRQENVRRVALAAAALSSPDAVRKFQQDIGSLLLKADDEKINQVIQGSFKELDKEGREILAGALKQVTSTADVRDKSIRELSENLSATASEKEKDSTKKGANEEEKEAANKKELSPEQKQLLEDLKRQREQERQFAQQAGLANALGRGAGGAGGAGGGGGGKSFKPNNDTGSAKPQPPPEPQKFSDIKDALRDLKNDRGNNRNNQRGFNSNGFQNSSPTNSISDSEKKKEENGGGFKLPDKKVGDTGIPQAVKDAKDATEDPSKSAEANPPLPQGSGGAQAQGPSSVPEPIATQYASSSSDPADASQGGGGGSSGAGGGLGGASLAGGKTGGGATADGGGAGFDGVGRVDMPPFDPPLRRIPQDLISVSVGGDGGEDGDSGGASADYTTPKMVKSGQGLFVNQLVMTAGNDRIRGRGIMAFTGTMRDLCAEPKGKNVGLCNKQRNNKRR